MRILSIAMLILTLLVAALPLHAQDDHTDALTITATLMHSAESEESPEFTALLAAVEGAGLADVLAHNGPFTVFAPTDAAFEALLASLEIDMETLSEDYELLLGVVLYHIVPGTFDAEAVSANDGHALATAFPGTSLSVDTVRRCACERCACHRHRHRR